MLFLTRPPSFYVYKIQGIVLYGIVSQCNTDEISQKEWREGHYLSNKKCFLCLHSLIQTPEGLGEFETVMQPEMKWECLHNYHEFSQRLECLYQAMQTQKKSFLLLL